MAMRAAGLTLEAPDKLMAALMALDAMKTDSDCDGTPEIEQLKMGRDPNPPGEYIDSSGRMNTKPDPGCSNTGPASAAALGSRAHRQVPRAPRSSLEPALATVRRRRAGLASARMPDGVPSDRGRSDGACRKGLLLQGLPPRFAGPGSAERL
jgi:hypothetical protein